MDGLFSSQVAAKAAGVSLRQATYWAKTGLVVPTRKSEGQGSPWRYDLRDVMALAVVAELRASKVSGQRCRKVQTALRDFGHTFTSARLLVFDRARGAKVDVRPADVLLAENDKEFLSLLESPGQYVVRATIPLGKVEKTTRRRLAAEVRKAEKARKAALENLARIRKEARERRLTNESAA